ncbi:MAG: four helix bundle protein [Candidatus Magasanikbacteria bacterium]|nr:four helix bundle protein [Candidatus Magasanikbacteria bacterium]
MEGDFSKSDREEFKKQLKARIYNWTVRLTKHARKIIKNLPNELHSIIDQLIRAGTSVCANYVEAQGSPTTKDFRNFLSYALKSCNESKYWLSLIKDSKIDEGEELKWLIKEGIEISNILGKSVSTMYRS